MSACHRSYTDREFFFCPAGLQLNKNGCETINAIHKNEDSSESRCSEATESCESCNIFPELCNSREVKVNSFNPLIIYFDKKNKMINQKQFGVWMDTHHATIVGSENAEGGLVVLAHVKGEEGSPSASNKNENHQKTMLQTKFFKEICSHLVNATHLHATGTGQVQEQFIHYLAATAQFKNTKTEESTANKMSDENLVKYFSDKLI